MQVGGATTPALHRGAEKQCVTFRGFRLDLSPRRREYYVFETKYPLSEGQKPSDEGCSVFYFSVRLSSFELVRVPVRQG